MVVVGGLDTVVVDILNIVLVSMRVVVCVGIVDDFFEIVVRFHGKIVLLSMKMMKKDRRRKRNIFYSMNCINYLFLEFIHIQNNDRRL